MFHQMAPPTLKNLQFWFWEDTKGHYMNYSNRTRFTKEIYLPRYSHDPFKHLKNTTIYVLLILTWKSILDTWEIYWKYVKKYKSSHNLDKSTTVKILFKRLQQILDNPNRMKDTNPIWIILSTAESSRMYVKEIQWSCICYYWVVGIDDKAKWAIYKEAFPQT